ncbi:MAG TPA: hypothetical protein PL151_12185 [Phycisphaerae bacterium]|nr:hypothetical protein [Phycisphaerae bacterium]HOJ75145.1 hypothetical protein [Phycisphaerae bacterium]HOM52375.1 hypothetical protein [Phycisphaerae bacterium]HON66243.1 hypothetical protein [Phycisphaerae bacterium]HOQ85160.1 hypothetical protein [Phycisphaerae bacterium]
MTQREKQELLDLFSIPANWCQETEARNWEGNSVRYDDPSAVAWDLTGAVCHLFGWERATQLFPILERYVVGRRSDQQTANPGIASMVNLQEFNDSSDTSFDILVKRLQSIPTASEPVPVASS